jgi:hypothetical protein
MIEVLGGADGTGNRQINDDVSIARARLVKAAMVHQIGDATGAMANIDASGNAGSGPSGPFVNVPIPGLRYATITVNKLLVEEAIRSIRTHALVKKG